jgi:hypothetical protein
MLLYIYTNNNNKNYKKMENLNLLHETIKGFTNIVKDFKKLKSEAVKSLITEVIKEDTGVDITSINTGEFFNSLFRMDLDVLDLQVCEGQYLFGRRYDEFKIRIEVNMSSMSSGSYHNNPSRFNLENRIKALQLVPYLTKEYQEELSIIANSVHLGEDEDFAISLNAKTWKLERENSRIWSDVAEVKNLEILETLLNNDLEINDKMWWGQGEYSYEYAETFRIDKINDKSIKCSFIKSRGLTEPRVVTRNLKTEAFFDMMWSFVTANKTTQELIESK